MPHAAWNVAVLCADPAGGDKAQRQLEAALAGLGLSVQCHVRQWQFGKLDDSSAFEATVDHALDADLVVLVAHDVGPLPEALQSIVAEWLIRSGNDASPFAVIIDGHTPIEEAREQMLAGLRRLTDHAHVPLYASFGDAVLVAWDLWQWKHFPWAAVAAEPPVSSPFNSTFIGQRHAARRRCGASPKRARAGTGGTSRRTRIASCHESSVRRCQP